MTSCKMLLYLFYVSIIAVMTNGVTSDIATDGYSYVGEQEPRVVSHWKKYSTEAALPLPTNVDAERPLTAPPGYSYKQGNKFDLDLENELHKYGKQRYHTSTIHSRGYKQDPNAKLVYESSKAGFKPDPYQNFYSHDNDYGSSNMHANFFIVVMILELAALGFFSLVYIRWSLRKQEVEMQLPLYTRSSTTQFYSRSSSLPVYARRSTTHQWC